MTRKKALTTGEVADYCGVNFRTVIRWIDKGLLKAYQLPGTRGDNRVRVSEFIDFLETQNIPVPEELLDNSRKVLIVEDDMAVAMTIDRLLKKYGFDTMIASDGFRAGMMLERFQPAVITLDLSMPGLNGFEVLKFVRSTPRLKNIKVIVVSALPPADLKRALDTGANEVMSKPFRGRTLAERVAGMAGVELREPSLQPKHEKEGKEKGSEMDS